MHKCYTLNTNTASHWLKRSRMDGNTICNYDGTECMSGVVRSLSCELKSIVSSPINIILHEQNISCENIRAPNISLRKIIAWKISRTGCLTNNQLILVDGLRRSHRQALDPLSAVKPAKRGSVLLMRRLGEVGAPLPLAASAEQAVEKFFREPLPHLYRTMWTHCMIYFRSWRTRATALSPWDGALTEGYV